MTKSELYKAEEKLYELVRREYGTTDEGDELVDIIWELVELAKDTAEDDTEE